MKNAPQRVRVHLILVVPGAGLEPARLAAGDFESPVVNLTKLSTGKDFRIVITPRILISGQIRTIRGWKMKRKSKEKNRSVERNIEARSDGFSFRVRMKINDTFINETFFSLDEARAYRDLLRAGKSTDLAQDKVLRAKAEKKKASSLTIGQLLDRYLQEVTIHKKGCREETYTIGKLQRIKSFSD
ncbi:MAG: hypothetical protein ACXU7D_05765, partial [Burkholderiaceae bacterium]